MKLLRLFPLELGRLLHSRMTWLIVLLTVISPAVGLVLYKPAIASTMLSMYLANPALAGGAAGGILFGLLTVYELDRAGRSRVEVLTNAVVSPLAAALVRLPALLAAAGLALVLTMLVWLPISCGLIGSIFDGATMSWRTCCSWDWRSRCLFWLPLPPINILGGRTCPWCSLPPLRR